MKQPTAQAGAAMPDHMAGAEPIKMFRRIGSTTYEVSVHFSATSKETMSDKIIRLIRNEVEETKAARQ